MNYIKKYLKINSYIEKSVIVDKCAFIGPNNIVKGKTIIKANCKILEGNYIDNCIIDENTTILKSVLEESSVGKNVKIGPYSHLRPGNKVFNNVKIGNFCEVKKSIINDNTKLSHLTYVGDAEIGKNCNIGCGVIFCNYDGKNKYKTYVGDHVFIGSNVNLIAPIKIESNSFIAAGTTVNKSVEENKFVIGRVQQEIKENKNLFTNK